MHCLSPGSRAAVKLDSSVRLMRDCARPLDFVRGVSRLMHAYPGRILGFHMRFFIFLYHAGSQEYGRSNDRQWLQNLYRKRKSEWDFQDRVPFTIIDIGVSVPTHGQGLCLTSVRSCCPFAFIHRGLGDRPQALMDYKKAVTTQLVVVWA